MVNANSFKEIHAINCMNHSGDLCISDVTDTLKGIATDIAPILILTY